MESTFGYDSTANLYVTTKSQRPFIFNKRCNIELDFNSATPTIANLKTNNIVLFGISREGDMYISGKIRLYFSDK